MPDDGPVPTQGCILTCIKHEMDERVQPILGPTPTRESPLLPTLTNYYTKNSGWDLFVDSIGSLVVAGTAL